MKEEIEEKLYVTLYFDEWFIYQSVYRWGKGDRWSWKRNGGMKQER